MDNDSSISLAVDPSGTNGFKALDQCKTTVLRVVGLSGELSLQEIPESEIPEAPELKLAFLEECVKAAVGRAGCSFIYELAAGTALNAICAADLYLRTDKNLQRYCNRVFRRDRATLYLWGRAATIYQRICSDLSVQPEYYSQLLPLEMALEPRQRECWDQAAKDNGNRAPTILQVKEAIIRLGALAPNHKKVAESDIPIPTLEETTPRPNLSVLGTPDEAVEAGIELVGLLDGDGDARRIELAKKILHFLERLVANATLCVPASPNDNETGWKIQPKAVEAPAHPASSTGDTSSSQSGAIPAPGWKIQPTPQAKEVAESNDKAPSHSVPIAIIHRAPGEQQGAPNPIAFPKITEGPDDVFVQFDSINHYNEFLKRGFPKFNSFTDYRFRGDLGAVFHRRMRPERLPTEVARIRGLLEQAQSYNPSGPSVTLNF